MSKGTIKTRAYKYNPSSCDPDWGDPWLPEDARIGSYEFEYDEKMKRSALAHKVAAWIAKKLVKEYKPLKYDPYPCYATVYGEDVGDGFVGAEVYYRGVNSTMKISARMQV